MDAKTYRVMKSLSAICKVIWREKKHIDEYGNWSLSHEIDNLRRTLQNLRAMARDVVPPDSYKRREEIKIRGAVASMYTNSRKAVTVYISKDVRYTSYDETSTKVRHSITVRYGWRKRIYSKFYEKGNLDAHHYFVLSAEEIRVNHPHIKLYEVQACGFKERKIMTMFVGQTTIGDCEATIKETSSEAIRAAKLLFEKQINNDLRRRNEDDERKA